MKSFSLFILIILMGSLGLQAQNGSPFAQTQQGAAVVSSIHVRQVAETRCEIEVRISGNLAHQVTNATISISGPSIPGGITATTISGGRLLGTGHEQVLLTGSFPILAAVQEGPTFAYVDVISASTSLSAGSYGDGRVFWHWSFPVSTTNP